MSIVIDLPSEIEMSLTNAWGSAENGLTRHILEAVAAEGYRSEVLSHYEVSRMLGLSFNATEAFLKDRGCYMHYSIEDLDADREAIEEAIRLAEEEAQPAHIRESA